MLAARAGHSTIVKILMDNGASLEAADSNGSFIPPVTVVNSFKIYLLPTFTDLNVNYQDGLPKIMRSLVGTKILLKF
jgi:hypothetical protein